MRKIHDFRALPDGWVTEFIQTNANGEKSERILPCPGLVLYGETKKEAEWVPGHLDDFYLLACEDMATATFSHVRTYRLGYEEA